MERSRRCGPTTNSGRLSSRRGAPAPRTTLRSGTFPQRITDFAQQDDVFRLFFGFDLASPASFLDLAYRRDHNEIQHRHRHDEDDSGIDQGAEVNRSLWITADHGPCETIDVVSAHQSDDRIHQVFAEGVNQCGERDADRNADRQIQYVPAQQELFETPDHECPFHDKVTPLRMYGFMMFVYVQGRVSARFRRVAPTAVHHRAARSTRPRIR